jgi:hypothetical protein
MHRREFMSLTAAGATSLGAEPHAEARWLSIAEGLKPRLRLEKLAPVALVKAVADGETFLQWRMERAAPPLPLKRGGSFIVDFGRHLTGTLAFSVEGVGTAVDSPVRLRLTFGEAPADVAVPLESYAGELSRAWLPDEVINIDFLPRRVEAPRRHAFRYVKFDVIDTSPNFAVNFKEIQATAQTSAGPMPPPLAASVDPLLRRIDTVSLATLRDCMQTVFEDGPRRDRRLWIGDLRLQAMTNYATFRNFDLVKRCLYLFAGLPREDGLVSACVYDEPKPLCGRQYIMDYAALYAAAVLDYVKASGDIATARELWPVVKRQFEILGQFIGADGLFRDPGGWWLFIDWREGLDTLAPMQAVLLFSYRAALELAQIAGEKVEYAERIEAMKKAAQDNCYDPQRKLFVSGKQRQISWATQAWMVLAGVGTPEQGAAALRAVAEEKDAVRPGTPYLNHYVMEAMLACGMKAEALALLRDYWGGMARAGADTFWEVYDPSNPALSPYKSILVNSYCHAWSCTPAWFLRGGKLS